MSKHVLILDSDTGFRHSLAWALRARGHSAIGVGTVNEAMAAIASRKPDLMVFDPDLQTADGLAFFESLVGQAQYADLTAAVVTARPERVREGQRNVRAVIPRNSFSLYQVLNLIAPPTPAPGSSPGSSPESVAGDVGAVKTSGSSVSTCSGGRNEGGAGVQSGPERAEPGEAPA